MTGSSFIERLMARPHDPAPAFPGFRRIGPPEPSAEPKILRPTYSYDIDWAAIDAARPEALRKLDDMGKAKLRQMMDQLIPGVCYETGRTTENGSTFIWARPVRVHPDWAPHVMAWGRVVAGLCP